MARHVKWCVNVNKWSPTRDEWLKLISSIADEEVERVNKFVYKEDAKTALIGRALIRKFVSNSTGRPSNEIKLTRSEYKRPQICADYLHQLELDSRSKSIDFNISHSGDYCVLAGVQLDEACGGQIRVGVDVTKIVKKHTKQELDRFLELMSRREFLDKEWELVANVAEARQKCINFTRLWCLKESFTKSLGLGLSFRLNRICFKFKDEKERYATTKLMSDKIVSDTCVILDGELAEDWQFLETALDEEHLVALAYNFEKRQPNKDNLEQYLDYSPFVEVPIKDLVEELSAMNEISEDHWTTFQSKSTKK